MLSLYNLKDNLRLALGVMLCAYLCIQCIRIFLIFTQKERRVSRTIAATEIVWAATAFALTHIVTSAQSEYYTGFIVSYSPLLRYVLFAGAFLGLYTALGCRRWDILALCAASGTLAATWDSSFFAYAFIVCTAYSLTRSAVLIQREWALTRSTITRLSVKETADLLSDGVIYINRRGKAFIANTAAENIAAHLGAKNIMAVPDFWQLLCGLSDSGGITRHFIDGKILLRIDGIGSWLISRTELCVRRKNYTQILALDITDEDMINKAIEDVNTALGHTSYELTQAVESIEHMEHEREILRIKLRFHDVLGQRLSILHQFVDRTSVLGDMNKLKPLLLDLGAVIRDGADGNTAMSELRALRESYALIGVTIHCKGTFPSEDKTARAFIKILRESTTNAVRHGFAKNITASVTPDSLSVKNDGLPADGELSEGGGIAGMRYRARELGGTFEIIPSPEFEIRVVMQ